MTRMHIQRPDQQRSEGRWTAVLCALLALFASATAEAQDFKGQSGLPIPRFVSLKADRVNVRVGPGKQFRIAWVFRRAGLPVEIIREHKDWRQIRDSVGETGWIARVMLSGRRTALVMPWAKSGGGNPASGRRARQLTLHASSRRSAAVVAVVEPGVVASVGRCDGSWCRVTVGRFKGYLEQRLLWGVYPKEVVK